MNNRIYRDNGAIGALLDEYELSIEALILLIETVTDEQLIQLVDTKTKDEDCRSIQSILTHVVESGYTYVIETRKWLGETVEYKKKISLRTTHEYAKALKVMFQYNEQLFTDYPEIKLCEHSQNKKIHVRWGQYYDVDQLMEHAIVHILRHRRQIERFLLKIENSSLQ